MFEKPQKAEVVRVEIGAVYTDVIKQIDDIRRHIRRAAKARLMRLVALSMAAEVRSNDLEPAGAEFLGPAEGGTARLKVYRAAVQKDDRPAVATNLKVQTNVGVLERWQ